MVLMDTPFGNKLNNDSTNIEVVGAPFPNEQVFFELHLRYPQNSASLPKIVEELSKESPQKRKYLSYEEYNSLYSADTEDIRKVKLFAASNYFKVVKVNRVLRLITLSGNIEDINKVFNIMLLLLKDSEFIYMGCLEKIFVPQALECIADCVLGLDYRPISRIFNPSSADAEKQTVGNFNSLKRRFIKTFNDTASETSWYPNRLAKLYDFPSPDIATGKGQSIAILEFGGGFKKKTLEEYFEKYINCKVPKVNAVPVFGGRNNPGHSENPYDVDSNADYEVYLDIEVVGAIAYDATINVYFGPTWLPGYVDYVSFWKTLASAVHDDKRRNSIVSCSWGWTEDSVCDMGKYLINQVMQEAAALNITVCSASGDDGTRCFQADGNRHVFFPASSPYTLACGGTKITQNNKHIEDECAWNENVIGQATGGGYSSFFPKPSYQNDISGMDIKFRGLPDISANSAQSYCILTHHDDKAIYSGGTSASTPLWAALFALMNESLGASTGFMNPFLYQLQNQQKGEAFNDITKGNNATQEDTRYNLPATQGYDARQGWDECTGLGSPRGNNLLNALKNC